MRKALIVGIDYYEHVSSLHGCVSDSYSVKSALERHGDGTLNFSVQHLTATGPDSPISRRTLKDSVVQLFDDQVDIALFYFSGHGCIESTGGYLVSSECASGDDGLSLNDVLTVANNSQAKSKVVILDSCHSGVAGNIQNIGNNAVLSEGVTILSASSAEQYAFEENGSGVFTSLLVDALNGGSANLVGDITPGSIYAHIDQSLGPWEQRPIFKTNVRNFTTLRKVQAPIALSDLKQLAKLFPAPNIEFQLAPSFEPESGEGVEENMEKFAVLQRLHRVNLVRPVDEEHMYFAAMNSKSCKLTVLGVHYWNLVAKERI